MNRTWLLALIVLTVPLALAHVGYVVPAGEQVASAGTDVPFLLEALQGYALLIVASLVVVTVAYITLRKSAYIQRLADHLNVAAVQYREFTPWIARLGLGMALIGAGTAGALISPATPYPELAFVQILFGFLLLAGFLTSFAAWGAIALYAVALATSTYMLGNLDFLALALAVVVLGSSRPGMDDLLKLPFFLRLRIGSEYVPLILRIGIGASMAYLALYEKLLNPHLSQLVVEQYGLQAVVPVSAGMWVLSAGLIELAVGLALLVGLRTRLVAAIAFVVLTLSFFYFKEAVYSHITLFATLSVLFVMGGGKLSLDAET